MKCSVYILYGVNNTLPMPCGIVSRAIANFLVHITGFKTDR